MRIKVLRYAAGRDDRIVSAFENVVFETPQAGWYVESRAGEGRCGLDALALVERVGEVAFVVDVRDRNTLMPEHIRAVTDEALHLRQRMQERIDRGAWIPLPYVAAFEALGWDAAPLVAHRERVLRKREEIKRSCRERRERAAEQRLREEQIRWQCRLLQGEADFRAGRFVRVDVFLGMCAKHKVRLHPRTLGVLRRDINELSVTHIAEKAGIRSPRLDGCFEAIRSLECKLTAAGDVPMIPDG